MSTLAQKPINVGRRAERMVRFMVRKYSPAPVSTFEESHARYVNGREIGHRPSSVTPRDINFYAALFRAYQDHYEWRIGNRADLLAVGGPQMLVMTTERRQTRNIVLEGIRTRVLREFADRDALANAEKVWAEVEQVRADAEKAQQEVARLEVKVKHRTKPGTDRLSAKGAETREAVRVAATALLANEPDLTLEDVAERIHEALGRAHGTVLNHLKKLHLRTPS